MFYPIELAPSRAPLKGVVIEASVIGNMQETLLSLLEGRNQQTVCNNCLCDSYLCNRLIVVYVTM